MAVAAALVLLARLTCDISLTAGRHDCQEAACMDADPRQPTLESLDKGGAAARVLLWKMLCIFSQGGAVFGRLN